MHVHPVAGVSIPLSPVHSTNATDNCEEAAVSRRLGDAGSYHVTAARQVEIASLGDIEAKICGMDKGISNMALCTWASRHADQG